MEHEPVDRPEYWRARLSRCKGEVHRAMFEGPFRSISAQEYLDRVELEKSLGRYDSVLDCGCGYGRLLYLLPDRWEGDYLGVDVSPDFLALAEVFHPSRRFALGDLRDLSFLGELTFDVAVVSWVRPMVITHLGKDQWDRMETQIKAHAREVIYLMESL